MASCVFITATDTDMGKTNVACLLLRLARMQGLRTIAIKPIAAGCVPHPTYKYLVNTDALALQSAATESVPYPEVNPIALAPAIAPHIAAAEAGESNLLLRSRLGWQAAYAREPDLLLCEGAGGWMLPLDQGNLMPQFVRETNQDVILVVGMKLGCLNHALLTVSAIEQSGCHLRGWIANTLTATPMPYYAENLATLQERIKAPLLAEVPYMRTEEDEISWCNRYKARLCLT